MAKEASARLLAALRRHHPDRCGQPSNLKAAPAILTPATINRLLSWMDARRAIPRIGDGVEGAGS
ncbi:hypothetical protein HHL26_04755 [Sphingobium sp. TB-6]|uniref:hypothetical protein n=1 Tax=Sphingobium sp. TB-6 TaxID=2728850 RepID=UPI00146D084F|nr:hypothetical protein [Sphingobium sp. TB-6]NML88375.1 hypothetical protein [Sphingobium sp. TB-6]